MLCGNTSITLSRAKVRHMPAAAPETVQIFANPHLQKPSRFPAGQNECFHPAKPSFYPSAVTAGITHYTLQAKSCAKGVPFGNPILSECVATLPPKRKISGCNLLVKLQPD